jgi:outer membrane protein assembly factor BamD (BamD/ComL family)
MYFQEGNFNHAIVEYEIFIARYWKNSLVPVAIVEIGDAYYNLQKYDKAIETYRKVLHDYPLNNAVYNAIEGIEYAYDIQEQNNKARKIIEEFYITHPEMKKQTNEKND